MMEARKMESFDSHEQIKNLIKTGIKEPQAEAIVKTLFLSRSSDTANLATKDQLNLVEQKLHNRIDQVEERLNNKIDWMEEKVLGIVKDAKFDTIKWMLALFITMMLGMLAIYFK